MPPQSYVRALKTSALQQILGALSVPHGIATLTGNVVLGKSDSWIMSLNPGAANRTVTLPPAGPGRVVMIRNIGTVSSLVVSDPAAVGLGTIPPGGLGVYVVNDRVWQLFWSSSIEAAGPIPDPGNAGAISVALGSGYVPIVTAAAETRTLAIPTAIGQQLDIYMKTDGGDCVITSAQGVNAANNTIITLNDAGDHLRLVAVEIGAALRWRVIVNNGATLA